MYLKVVPSKTRCFKRNVFFLFLKRINNTYYKNSYRLNQTAGFVRKPPDKTYKTIKSTTLHIARARAR